MTTIRFNVSLIVAIIAVGMTFTARSSFSGERTITRCFPIVSLTNCAGNHVVLDATTSTPPTCIEAKQKAASHPFIAAASLADSFPNEEACNGETFFCCLTIAEVLPTDPNYACSPFVDLGEGLKKYKVAVVYCKD